MKIFPMTQVVAILAEDGCHPKVTTKFNGSYLELCWQPVHFLPMKNLENHPLTFSYQYSMQFPSLDQKTLTEWLEF